MNNLKRLNQFLIFQIFLIHQRKLRVKQRVKLNIMITKNPLISDFSDESTNFEVGKGITSMTNHKSIKI